MSLAPSYSSPFFEKWLLHEVLEFLKGITLAAIVVTFLARLCVETNDVNFYISSTACVAIRKCDRPQYYTLNNNIFLGTKFSCLPKIVSFRIYEFMIFILSTPSSHHQLSIWKFLSSERTKWAHHKSIDKLFEFEWKVYFQVRERTHSIMWLCPIEHVSQSRFSES